MSVHTLSVTGAPTGGSFTLRVATGPVGGGQTYDATIPFNASAAAVKAAIENLPNMQPNSVAASGGALPATPVVLTFQGMNRQHPRAITIGTNSLTGGTTPTPSVAEDITKRPDLVGRNDSGSVKTQPAAGAWGNP